MASSPYIKAFIVFVKVDFLYRFYDFPYAAHVAKVVFFSYPVSLWKKL